MTVSSSRATKKHIYTDEHGLRLEPANPNYDDIIIEPEEFEEVHVLGR